ncbi:hypothetical protein ACOTJR_27970 [Achromobacter xylosoxidans]
MVNTFYTPFNLSGRHPYADFAALVEAARFTLEYPIPGTETNGLSLIGVSATPGTAQPCFTLAGAPHTLAPCEGEYIVVDGYVDPSTSLPPAAISIAASARDNHPTDAGAFAGPDELAAWMRRVAKPFTARPGDDGYDAAKKGMPAFGPSYQGKTRSGANAVDVPYILLDADSMDGVSPDALIAACKKLGPGLAWASLSSTDAAPRRKILIWMAAPVDKLNAKAAARALITRLRALMPGVRIEYGSDKGDAPGARIFYDQSQQAGGQLCFLPAQGAHIETWDGTPAAVEYEGPTVTAREFNPAADDGDDTSPRAVAAIECLDRLDLAAILETQDSGAARETIKTAIMAARYEGVSRAHLWGKLAGVADETIRRYRFDDLIEREQATVANPVGIGALRQLARMDIASADEFPIIEGAPACSLGAILEKIGAVSDKSLARAAAKALANDLRIAGHKAKQAGTGRLYWWSEARGLWEADDTGGILDDRLHRFIDAAYDFYSTRVELDAKGRPRANPIAQYANYRTFTGLRSMFLSVVESSVKRLPADASGSLWKLAMKGEDGGAVMLDITGKDITLRRTTKDDFATVVTDHAVVLPARAPTVGTLVEDLRRVAPTWAHVLETMVSGADQMNHYENFEQEQIYAAAAALALAALPSAGTDKIVTFTGASRSGKTKMLEAIGHLLGGRLLRPAGSGYMASDRTGAGNDTVLAGALHAHILFADEVTKIDAAKACALTGTVLGAADKNEKFAQVHSRLTLVLASNGLTPYGDDEQIRALCNRIYPILSSTSSAGNEDPELPAKLKAEVGAALGMFVAVLHAECWKTGAFAPALPVYGWTGELARKLVYKGASTTQREWLTITFDVDASEGDEDVSAVELTREWRAANGLPELKPNHRAFMADRDSMVRALRAVGYAVPATGHAKVRVKRNTDF